MWKHCQFPTMQTAVYRYGIAPVFRMKRQTDYVRSADCASIQSYEWNDSPTRILHLAIPISKHIPHQVSMKVMVVICGQSAIFELPTSITDSCSNLRSEPLAERCGNRWSYPIKKVSTANRFANERTCTTLKTDKPVFRSKAMSRIHPYGKSAPKAGASVRHPCTTPAVQCPLSQVVQPLSCAVNSPYLPLPELKIFSLSYSTHYFVLLSIAEKHILPITSFASCRKPIASFCLPSSCNALPTHGYPRHHPFPI